MLEWRHGHQNWLLISCQSWKKPRFHDIYDMLLQAVRHQKKKRLYIKRGAHFKIVLLILPMIQSGSSPGSLCRSALVVDSQHDQSAFCEVCFYVRGEDPICSQSQSFNHGGIYVAESGQLGSLNSSQTRLQTRCQWKSAGGAKLVRLLPGRLQHPSDGPERACISPSIYLSALIRAHSPNKRLCSSNKSHSAELHVQAAQSRVISRPMMAEWGIKAQTLEDPECLL